MDTINDLFCEATEILRSQSVDAAACKQLRKRTRAVVERLSDRERLLPTLDMLFSALVDIQTKIRLAECQR